MTDDPPGPPADEDGAGLASRSSRLDAIVDDLPVGVFVTSSSGEFRDVNDAMVSLVGADSRRALLDRRVEDLYEDPDERTSILGRLRDDGTVRGEEVRLRALDGTTVRVSITARLVEDDGEQYVEGIVEDVTGEREAEREREEYRRRLTEITESTEDVLWLFTADFEELLFVNDAYEDIWGRPVAELAADPSTFLEPINPDDRESVVAAMDRLGDGEPVDVRYRITTPDGETRWLWSKGEPVYEDGEVHRVAGFSREVTDRKRRERTLREYRERLEATVAELERSNEELEQFAYVASHDLQEPLRMVSSFVDLLATEYEGQLDEEADEYIHYAVDGANRMKAMIDGLLRFSRVQTETGSFETVDAEGVLDDALRDLSLRIEGSRATVTRDPLPTLTADPDQLAQIFRNLVDNAITHGGESPTVHVGASVADDAVTFSVDDDGPGIHPDYQDGLFDIFEQGSRDSEGTGIGLAICERIVHLHGGDIRVDSTPGEGATFTFTIPQPPSGRHQVDHPTVPEVVDE